MFNECQMERWALSVQNSERQRSFVHQQQIFIIVGTYTAVVCIFVLKIQGWCLPPTALGSRYKAQVLLTKREQKVGYKL